MSIATLESGAKPGGIEEPSPRAIVGAVALAFAGVFLSRIPVARPSAFDFDEVGYLEVIAAFRFPMHHTLFLASARNLGLLLGDAYRGFLLLDMVVSALALAASWWWLRAIVGPRTAAAATLVLGAAPAFWSYGAMAGNYAAIPLVGSILLGIAFRGWSDPRPWHPHAAAVALALGAGYRQDIGVFWMPAFLAILWQHRWIASAQAVLLFTAINLAWLIPMLHEVGGWEEYRRASARFAEEAGRKNSVSNLGPVDAPLRYAVKGIMALGWTFGPGLLFVPRGLRRWRDLPNGGRLGLLLVACAAPALASHLLVHFGVPGYAFHYVPGLLALIAMGIGRCPGLGRRDGRAGTAGGPGGLARGGLPAVSGGFRDGDARGFRPGDRPILAGRPEDADAQARSGGLADGELPGIARRRPARRRRFDRGRRSSGRPAVASPSGDKEEGPVRSGTRRASSARPGRRAATKRRGIDAIGPGGDPEAHGVRDRSRLLDRPGEGRGPGADIRRLPRRLAGCGPGWAWDSWSGLPGRSRSATRPVGLATTEATSRGPSDAWRSRPSGSIGTMTSSWPGSSPS